MSRLRELQAHLHVRGQLCQLLPILNNRARALERELEDAEDLVQTTCLQALAQADQWYPGSSVRDWLLGIMQQEWLRTSKARSIKTQHAEEAGRDLDIEGQWTDRIHERITLRDLEQAIQEMPKSHSDLLIMIGVQGVSYKEAAITANLPVGTVMSRLHRARMQLAANLDLPSAAPPKLHASCAPRHPAVRRKMVMADSLAEVRTA
jgi:RNA polymerase sigma-70 factor, ECF subfamily